MTICYEEKISLTDEEVETVEKFKELLLDIQTSVNNDFLFTLVRNIGSDILMLQDYFKDYE